MDIREAVFEGRDIASTTLYYNFDLYLDGKKYPYIQTSYHKQMSQQKFYFLHLFQPYQPHETVKWKDNLSYKVWATDLYAELEQFLWVED